MTLALPNVFTIAVPITTDTVEPACNISDGPAAGLTASPHVVVTKVVTTRTAGRIPT